MCMSGSLFVPRLSASVHEWFIACSKVTIKCASVVHCLFQGYRQVCMSGSLLVPRLPSSVHE